MHPWMKTKIELHFDYMWQNDKNVAFRGEVEEAILDQIPKEHKE